MAFSAPTSINVSPAMMRYVLARPAEQIRLKDILDAVRHATHGEQNFGEQARVGAVAARLWHDLDAELARSSANRTLRELIEKSSD